MHNFNVASIALTVLFSFVPSSRSSDNQGSFFMSRASKTYHLGHTCSSR